jgi:uncharacterized protein
MTDTDEKAKPPATPLPLNRRTVIIFSLAAAAIFSLIAWVVTVRFRGQTFQSLFTAGRPLATQILIGLVAGLALAFAVVLLLLKAPLFARLRDFIRSILAQLRPTGFDMLLVSLLAGFSEELFFRAALQPALGLWLAALVFALAHTGVSVSPAKLAFAAFVFVMGLLLGTLYERAGLVAAIVAHAVYDLIFLLAVNRFLRPPNAGPAP